MRALLAAALLVAACGANVTRLTSAQEAYLAAHPERGPRDRNAALYRIATVGDSLEWVRVAWDGVAFRGVHTGGPLETWEAHVAVDARPVSLSGPGREEQVQRGTVLLTFKGGKLATWVVIE